MPNSQRQRWFQHTAARRRLELSFFINNLFKIVSTHSRPKAAGGQLGRDGCAVGVSTHSRPKAAGRSNRHWEALVTFQHTAARRRLVVCNTLTFFSWVVSTHSRPKAAGCCCCQRGQLLELCFNTQPPEGGWARLRRGGRRKS